MDTNVTAGPGGAGYDAANPAAGSTRLDRFQAAVYGVEYAVPERWGPAAPPYPDPPEKSADEASENYYAGDPQPQVKEVDLPAGGLRADMARESTSPTDRGPVELSRERPDVPDRTWEGQTFGSANTPAGATALSRPASKNIGTSLQVDIPPGGARAGGLIPLPAHMQPPSSGRGGRKR